MRGVCKIKLIVRFIYAIPINIIRTDRKGRMMSKMPENLPNLEKQLYAQGLPSTIRGSRKIPLKGSKADKDGNGR
jgi:hypothetical protein